MNDNISAFNSNEYDKAIEMTVPYYNEIQNEIIEIVDACYNKEINWLDVGCGTGSMIEKAVQRLKIKSVTLIDVSDTMLSVAEACLKTYDIDKRFWKTNAHDLALENEFDVISAIQVFHYLNIKQKKFAIKNCYNALKPGGIMLTCENISPFSKNGTDISLERWKNYQIKQGKSVAEADNHIARFGKNYFPINIEEHLKVLRNAGFRYTEVFHISYLQAAFYAIK